MRMACLLAAAGLAVSATAAQASDFEIIDPGSTGLKRGAKLKRGDKVSLPDGVRITFYDNTAGTPGQSRHCDGKYDGPIEGCRPKASGAPTKVPGGTRGARP